MPVIGEMTILQALDLIPGASPGLIGERPEIVQGGSGKCNAFRHGRTPLEMNREHTTAG
jgi:hypothetical protein